MEAARGLTQCSAGMKRSGEGRTTALDGPRMRTAMRWAGVVALVANSFLSQELVRIMSDQMDRVSQGERLVMGGWMRLSGAAWPATWIYWASHLWTIAAL